LELVTFVFIHIPFLEHRYSTFNPYRLPHII
jgi:hypothetical protein